MDWKELGKSLAKLGLPLLGAALPIPGGAALGTLLASQIGAAPDAKPADILARLTQDAGAMEKAREFELTHKETMLRAVLDYEARTFETEVKDRESARAREMAVRDSIPAKLAWTIIGGFLAVSAAQLAMVMGYPELAAKIPPQGWLLIGNISGYLANEAKQAAAYYFGSSSGSKAKDDTLSEIAKG